MYHQFNTQQFYVLPTQTVFMCFVWIWEQTAIISLYSVNWLVCTTEREFVYCAVRPGSYIKLKFIYAPLAMPRFRYLVFGLSSLGPGFNSKSSRGSLWWRKCRVLHISHECSILLFIHTFQLPAEKMGEAWPAANESVIFRKSWREGVAFTDHRAVCSWVSLQPANHLTSLFNKRYTTPSEANPTPKFELPTKK